MASQVPGVSQRSNGPGQTEYEMRGMSSSGGSAPTVGFYLNDVALTAPAASDINKAVIDPNLYDLDRIEILRGPQGTLYGSSSMGGTIRLITRQPDTHAFNGSALVTGSGTKDGGFNYALNAAVNIPLVEDHLALRVVGTDRRDDGWIDRVYITNFPLPVNDGLTRGDVLATAPTKVRKNANWQHIRGVRASLLWQPTDELSMTPSVMYQKLSLGGQFLADDPPGARYEAHYQPFDFREPSSDRFTLLSLPVKYQAGAVQIDAISGYYKRTNRLVGENAENIQDYLQVYLAFPTTFDQVGPVLVQNRGRDSQFTQELRLSSINDSPFRWLIGGYYQDYTSRFFITTNQASPYLAGAFGNQTELFDINYRLHIKQYAGFGEASYKLGAVKFTTGLRYYSYKTSLRTIEYGLFVNGAGPDGASNTTFRQKDSGVIPRFNITYAPSPDLTLYAQAAKGFRPGSGLPPAPDACGVLPTSYKSDSVWSYEAGEKARLFDRRLTLNASGYYENWKNIQQLVAVTQCGYVYSDNAGTAHIYGAEAELSLMLARGLLVSNSLGYTHATLASVPSNSTFQAGARIQEVPKWTNTASVSYTYPLTTSRDLVLRATYEYVGNQQVEVNSLYTVPSHNFFNLRAGITSKRSISAALFVNNITNAHTILNQAYPLSVFIPSYIRTVVPQPRTIGVDLSYQF